MKPFKGVISGWCMIDNRVHGTCVFHTDYDNGIERGQRMITSPVHAILNHFGATVCETKNSFYVLIKESR